MRLGWSLTSGHLFGANVTKEGKRRITEWEVRVREMKFYPHLKLWRKQAEGGKRIKRTRSILTPERLIEERGKCLMGKREGGGHREKRRSQITVRHSRREKKEGKGKKHKEGRK